MFHTISEIISEISPESTAQLDSSGLLNNFSADLATLAKENSQKFWQLIQKRLSEQNVELLESGGVIDRTEFEILAKQKIEKMVEDFLQ